MFQERARTLQGVSATLDVLCLCVAFAAAFPLRIYHDSLPFLSGIPSTPWQSEGAVRADYAMLLLVSIVAWVVSMHRSGLYRFGRMRSPAGVAFSLLRALCLALLATATAAFVLKMATISRLFFGYYFGLSFALLTTKQLGLLWLYHSLRRSDVSRRHALVIGAGGAASWFANVLQDAAEHGYQLVGLLLTRKVVSAQTFSVPVVGMIEDLDRVLIDYPVDEVFIVGTGQELVSLGKVTEELISRGRVVSLVSAPLTSTQGVRGRVTEFSGVPMISFGPMPRDEVALGVKRVFDVAISAGALVVLSPLIALAALAIKVLDPGPIFFAQERLGEGGRPFRLYKLRSMRVDAEELLKRDQELFRHYVANDFKLPEDQDPRISQIGRFLRKTSIDELPQLWNVLKGDMTLVGPRPVVPAELANYGAYASLFVKVKPGITGLWQIAGRSDIRYPERAHLDLDYVSRNTLMSDFGILARTIPAVTRGRGAY